MKKVFAALVIAALNISTATAGGMWQLIKQEVSGGQFYCTYRLQGTTVIKVISGGTGCQQFIYEQ